MCLSNQTLNLTSLSSIFLRQLKQVEVSVQLQLFESKKEKRNFIENLITIVKKKKNSPRGRGDQLGTLSRLQDTLVKFLEFYIVLDDEFSNTLNVSSLTKNIFYLVHFLN